MKRVVNKENSLASTLSLLTIALSVTIVFLSLPFVLIAGLGLLLVIPFGSLAITEQHVRQAICIGGKLSAHTRRKRLALIGCSFLGSTIIIVLLQLANKSNNELSSDRKIQALIPWVAALIVFVVSSVSVQILYKKK